MTTLHRTCGWAALCVLTLTGLLAPAPPIDDPSDREPQRRALQQSVRENCLFCHTDEMIGSQRLTPKQWKTEVEKMVGWGSPLPREQQQPVIDFLASEYPADAAPARATRITYKEAVDQDRADSKDGDFAGDAHRGEPAYVKNCANCHGREGQGADLGPNLVEKPVLWKRADYQIVVLEGRGRMPGFAAALDPATGNDVLAWLRSRRYRPEIATGK